MERPELDIRNKKDLMEHMKKLSHGYVPEWRLDEDDPDLGTMLAYIYVDMFEKTLKQWNFVLQKNKIAFFQELNTNMLPASAAEGYVQLNLVNREQSGVEVKKDTRVISDALDEEGKNLIFETVDDIYVTPAYIEDMYCVSGEKDKIISINKKESFYLFDLKGKNLQEHSIYLYHEEAWRIKGECEIILQFRTQFKNPKEKELLRNLADVTIARFEYYSEEGYCQFQEQRIEGDGLLLKKGLEQPPFSKAVIEEKEAYWIRCTIKDIKKVSELYINTLEVSLTARNNLPDIVHVQGVNQTIEQFYPFGEQFSIYNEVYFSSEEVFSKKGAMIEMKGRLNFIRVPMENSIQNEQLEWKSIMKASDFKINKKYDITIEEVVWEYYNGNGWNRLFSDKRYENVFGAEEGMIDSDFYMKFYCPEDISNITIQSCNSYFIRARILKVNNAFKAKGDYIAPILEKLHFDYQYDRKKIVPNGIAAINNLEKQQYGEEILKTLDVGLRPFLPIEIKENCMYLGFKVPPDSGPIKILFSVKDQDGQMPSKLLWEYFAYGKWFPLSVVDETEGMIKTGIVTFIIEKNFDEKILFGKKRYWIRIKETEKRAILPCIEGIYLNTVKIINKEKKDTQIFTAQYQEINKICSLGEKKIYDAQVWVEEMDCITNEEISFLEREERVQIVKDQEGVGQEIWVKWQEREDFMLSGPEDRHYVLDRNQGKILFSDGKNGKLPSAKRKSKIKVNYWVGGGESGNLPQGAINRLGKSIGFINYVSNPEITFGGSNQETMEQAVNRVAKTLKHRYRAVTEKDYEALAKEADYNILKVKCFSNHDRKGEKNYGKITLVVLQRNFKDGKKYFPMVKKRILEYMKDKMDGNLMEMENFFVVQPTFLILDVKVEVLVKDFNQVFDVRERIETKLHDFLHPVTGNFDGKGWAIGTIPNKMQIENYLKGIKGILYFKNIYIISYEEKGIQRIEIDLEKGRKFPYALPISGKHKVYVTV